MLFELAGPAASLLVDGSSETTTGVAAEVDVELWLVRLASLMVLGSVRAPCAVRRIHVDLDSA